MRGVTSDVAMVFRRLDKSYGIASSPYPRVTWPCFIKLSQYYLLFKLCLLIILVCIFMDMNTLEFAQITGGIYENLEQKQSFVAMRSYIGMLRIPLLCCSNAPERNNEASHSSNMECYTSDALNTVNCRPGYFVKKQKMKICQSRNKSICFAVRWW